MPLAIIFIASFKNNGNIIFLGFFFLFIGMYGFFIPIWDRDSEKYWKMRESKGLKDNVIVVSEKLDEFNKRCNFLLKEGYVQFDEMKVKDGMYIQTFAHQNYIYSLE